MTDRERFYAERDRRTIECGVPDIFNLPVAVFVGRRAASCLRGQIATLALVNMLARLHRRLQLRIPAVPMIRRSILSAARLDEAAFELARIVDPFVQIERPDGKWSAAIGIGADAPTGLPWYAGADTQVATIDNRPVGVDEHESPSLGACLSACVAAATLLRQVLNRPCTAQRVSAWDLSVGDAAVMGPASIPAVDVGDVLFVGAGGVGSCLAYWLREFQVCGWWWVVDGDFAELHNTNRCLALFPRDAGWPDLTPCHKATAAAEYFGADSREIWYDQFDHDQSSPDLVLPLANERSVRHLINSRGEPLLIHATTSRLWEAQLHRHIPDHDDCILCRMPETKPDVELACSTVSIPTEPSQSSDAALPFLSATAGLLLLSALTRLQHGELHLDRYNSWSVCFDNAHRVVRRARFNCRRGCDKSPPATIRSRVYGQSRWTKIDKLAHQYSRDAGNIVSAANQ